jgi:uncharacterized membrane protein
MQRSVLLALVLALSFLGIADSWYLFQSAVTDTALTCDIGAGLDGCNIVAQSPYSQFLGIPLALYGVGFFALVFAVGGALFLAHARLLQKGLLALAAFGAAASLMFVYIQFFLIKALCIYCLLSAGITFVLLFIAWKLAKAAKQPRIDS